MLSMFNLVMTQILRVPDKVITGVTIKANFFIVALKSWQFYTEVKIPVRTHRSGLDIEIAKHIF